MILRSISSVLTASFVCLLALAACRTAGGDRKPTDERRNVIAVESRDKPTRRELVDQLVAVAKRCWIGKSAEFANLVLQPVEPYPGHDGFKVRFKDPKQTERYAEINIIPESGTSGGGYIVQIVQKGQGFDIERSADAFFTQIDDEARNSLLIMLMYPSKDCPA